jgi:hypothetical protein
MCQHADAEGGLTRPPSSLSKCYSADAIELQYHLIQYMCDNQCCALANEDWPKGFLLCEGSLAEQSRHIELL